MQCFTCGGYGHKAIVYLEMVKLYLLLRVVVCPWSTALREKCQLSEAEWVRK